MKVKLKNAVMQKWTQVKNKRKTKSISDLLDMMMADKEKNKKRKKEAKDKELDEQNKLEQ